MIKIKRIKVLSILNRMRFTFLIMGFLLITGCAQKHTIKPETMMNDKKFDDNLSSRKSIQGHMESDKDEGLYVLKDGSIVVKTDGRSIISIIDEVAFKLRLNYTVLTSIPKQRIKLASLEDQALKWEEKRGRTFSTVTELFTLLEKFMNQQCQKSTENECNYNIVQTDDGITITNNVVDTNFTNNYKKIFLYNLDAEKAQAHIKEFFFKGDNEIFSMINIISQNAIIVKSQPAVLSQIGEIIHAIDSQSPQVMIEGQVFEYDDTIGRKIGTSLTYAGSGVEGNNNDWVAGVTSQFGEGVTNLLPTITGSLTNAEKKKSILAAIALQDRSGRVKIMAEPRIVLKPGNKGTLNLNTVKYVIVGGDESGKLEQIETGITFAITPMILSDSSILLEMTLEQSEFIPSNEANIVQAKNKNTITTSVVVEDGELISIGGIYMERGSKFSSGIPFLKDLPVVGFLFGSDSKDSSRVMVEFMIRPTIKNLNTKLKTIKKQTLDVYQEKSKDL